MRKLSILLCFLLMMKPASAQQVLRLYAQFNPLLNFYTVKNKSSQPLEVRPATLSPQVGLEGEWSISSNLGIIPFTKLSTQNLIIISDKATMYSEGIKWYQTNWNSGILFQFKNENEKRLIEGLLGGSYSLLFVNNIEHYWKSGSSIGSFNFNYDISKILYKPYVVAGSRIGFNVNKIGSFKVGALFHYPIGKPDDYSIDLTINNQQYKSNYSVKQSALEISILYRLFHRPINENRAPNRTSLKQRCSE